MCYIFHASSPLGDRLLTRIDGQSHALQAETLIELGDAGGVRLINERIIDITDSGT